jgi:ADP-heptose:LPS heptosyltransferase
MCQRQLTLALQLHGSGDISNEIVHGFGARAMAGFGRGPAVHGQNTVLLPYPDAGTEPERLLSLVEQLGGAAVGSHLEFPLHRQDLRELEDSGVARGLEPGSYICVHPGARARDKCWPAQCFAQVGDQLAREFGLTVALTGAGSERALAQDVASQMESRAVNAAAPISIGAMAALMEGARLLVCNDTGVSHIAAGLKLKSVVIFSKADIARWAPLDRHNHRCIWDPDGERAAVVLQHARALLSGTGTGPERAVGMWPYW